MNVTNDIAENQSQVLCSDEPFDSITYHVRVTLMVPIISFGLVANIFNALVFRHNRMKASVLNWYLVVLAYSDLLVLLCSFLMLSFPAIVEDFKSFALFTTAVYMQRWIYALAMTVQTSSVIITILVSGHRFLGVCYPFLAQKICTHQRVKLAITAAVALSFIFNVSRWWELDIEQCFSQAYNQTGIKVLESHLRFNPTYYVAFMLCTYTLFMFFIPFILLIFMNAMIMKAIHASYRLRQRMSRTRKVPRTASTAYTSFDGNRESSSKYTMIMQNNGSKLRKVLSIDHNQENCPEVKTTTLCEPQNRTASLMSRASSSVATMAIRSVDNKDKYDINSETKENKTTIMLIAVVFMFLICNCLAFINNILEMAIVSLGKFGTWNEIFSVSVEISNCLVAINSTCNIIIYTTFSVKFRRLLFNYLSCCFTTLRTESMSISNRAPSFVEHINVSKRSSNYKLAQTYSIREARTTSVRHNRNGSERQQLSSTR